MTSEKYFELRFMLQEYVKKYGKYYKPDDLLDIMQRFIPAYDGTAKINALLLEAYEECGILEKIKPNPYEAFRKHIKEDYDINGELLEVGCGPIPSLAKSIKKEQKHGSITVMDPIIKIKDYGSLKIINKKFTDKTDVSKYSLVYGFAPCGATKTMITNSCKNDVDLYIQLCGCTENGSHNDYDEYIYILNELLYKSVVNTGRSYAIFQNDDLPYPTIKTFR